MKVRSVECYWFWRPVFYFSLEDNWKGYQVYSIDSMIVVIVKFQRPKKH